MTPHDLSGPQLDAMIASEVPGLATNPPAAFSSDLNEARRVEEAIQSLGLTVEYEQALWNVTGARYDIPAGVCVIVSHWPLIHADARERCVAALQAVRSRSAAPGQT